MPRGRLRPWGRRPLLSQRPDGTQSVLKGPLQVKGPLQGLKIPGYSRSSPRDCPSGAKTGSTKLKTGVILNLTPLPTLRVTRGTPNRTHYPLPSYLLARR
jgi:hypothetical protein